MKRMARQPIAVLPNGRLIWESDLDVTLGERILQAVAIAVLVVIIFAVIFGLLALGGLFLGLVS
jgi:hypothetical protein